jgi:hypothetical protein
MYKEKYEEKKFCFASLKSMKKEVRSGSVQKFDGSPILIIDTLHPIKK